MSAWEKTKRYSKKGFDKAWDTVDKLGGPVNRLSNKLGAEAFWPMAIDKESDKAARILRSFCKDGFYAPESEQSTDENGKINRPKGKQRVIKKIPSKVIKNAKGIAIFTTMRTGLWISGSGGSGVLLARIPETGEWSPPSGIMLHTAAIGFLAGVDIYDCVVVINTYEALEAFKKVRCTLGGEVSAAAGPVGMGGVLNSEVHKRQSPIWTYMKSKGLYAGVAVDGTIIIERTDENEKFYGERISVTDILAGKVRHPPDSINTLLQTIKAAQGDVDVDESLVAPSGETPGDLDVSGNDHLFGVPDVDDPDPYGVKALEAEGMFIREAGSKVRPSHEAFEFRPNPGSPVYATFSRRSLDSSPRNSWRASVQSYTSVDRGTQTEDASLTAPTSVSRASSLSAKESTNGPSANPWEEDEKAGWDTVPIHGGEEKEEGTKEETRDARDLNGHAETEKNLAAESDDEFEVHEVSNATITRPESPKEEQVDAAESKRMSPTFTRAKLVTINKRPTPPALPPRHPRHTWGSGSSRESTSPTALSHTSRSTEETETAPEATESTEKPTESSGLPSNVKKLQTSTVVPTVVDEVDFDESDSELPADKDEFLSAHSDNEDDNERHSLAEGLAALKAEGIKTDAAETEPKESVAETEAPKAETQTEKKEVEGAEDVLSQLEEKFPSPEVESPAKKVDVQKTSSNNKFGSLEVDEESDDTIETPADQKPLTSDISPKTQA
jgi:lipid-binding SYLF domain-containing protein